MLVGDLLPGEHALLKTPPLADSVELLGPQPYETAMNFAAGATMLLLVTPPELRSIATRKLFDYLAVRRPVFALAEGNEAARILAETLRRDVRHPRSSRFGGRRPVAGLFLMAGRPPGR